MMPGFLVEDGGMEKLVIFYFFSFSIANGKQNQITPQHKIFQSCPSSSRHIGNTIGDM